MHGTVGTYTNEKCRCDECKVAWASYIRNWRDNKARSDRYLKKYGLTEEHFLRLVRAQGDRCGICRRPRESLDRDFSVDHDHETGLVRGLLCSRCNTGLGQLGDDLNGLLSAVAYIQNHLNAAGGEETEETEEIRSDLAASQPIMCRIGPG